VADNLTAPAAGAVLATDDIGGVQYPRSKMTWGVDGAAVDTADAANARIPVKVGDGLGAASVITGHHTVATGSSTALPTATARRFRLKALNSNIDTVYIGASGVTVAGGGQPGFPLDPGDLSPQIEVSNLNVIRAISPTVAQVLAYLGEV
jgi:hypothetical protein